MVEDQLALCSETYSEFRNLFLYSHEKMKRVFKLSASVDELVAFEQSGEILDIADLRKLGLLGFN